MRIRHCIQRGCEWYNDKERTSDIDEQKTQGNENLAPITEAKKLMRIFVAHHHIYVSLWTS